MSGNTFRVPYLNGKIRKGVWVIWLIALIVQIPEGLFYDDDVFQANFAITAWLLILTVLYQVGLYKSHNAGWFSWLLKDDRIEVPRKEPPTIRGSEIYNHGQTHITHITLNDSVYVEDKKN